jgi:hypothetical protein
LKKEPKQFWGENDNDKERRKCSQRERKGRKKQEFFFKKARKVKASHYISHTNSTHTMTSSSFVVESQPPSSL